MAVETITLQLPEALARELSAASQTFLLNILERGLRELKIDQALYLVTGDEDLLVLKQIDTMTIVSPREFMTILNQTK